MCDIRRLYIQLHCVYTIMYVCDIHMESVCTEWVYVIVTHSRCVVVFPISVLKNCCYNIIILVFNLVFYVSENNSMHGIDIHNPIIYM